MKFNTITPEEHARILEKSQVIYEKHKADIGADIVERAQSILADLRK